MAERRTSARQKSFLRGRALYNNRQSALDCLIRDFSEQGANLIFSETVSIPETVDLYIPQKDQMFRAHVQWRSGGEVGVAFGEPTTVPSMSGDLTGRVERLEQEVASLRRMFKRLKADMLAGNEPESV